jgi:hypothetical protein
MQADSMDYGAVRQRFLPLIALATTQLVSAADDPQIDTEAVAVLLYGQVLYTAIDQAGQRDFFGADLSDAKHAARMRDAFLRSARLLLGIGTRLKIDGLRADGERRAEDRRGTERRAVERPGDDRRRGHRRSDQRRIDEDCS